MKLKRKKKKKRRKNKGYTINTMGWGILGDDMNEELGFIKFHPIPANDGDLYVEWDRDKLGQWLQ